MVAIIIIDVHTWTRILRACSSFPPVAYCVVSQHTRHGAPLVEGLARGPMGGKALGGFAERKWARLLPMPLFRGENI